MLHRLRNSKILNNYLKIKKIKKVFFKLKKKSPKKWYVVGKRFNKFVCKHRLHILRYSFLSKRKKILRSKVLNFGFFIKNRIDLLRKPAHILGLNRVLHSIKRAVFVYKKRNDLRIKLLNIKQKVKLLSKKLGIKANIFKAIPENAAYKYNDRVARIYKLINKNKTSPSFKNLTTNTNSLVKKRVVGKIENSLAKGGRKLKVSRCVTDNTLIDIKLVNKHLDKFREGFNKKIIHKSLNALKNKTNIRTFASDASTTDKEPIQYRKFITKTITVFLGYKENKETSTDELTEDDSGESEYNSKNNEKIANSALVYNKIINKLSRQYGNKLKGNLKTKTIDKPVNNKSEVNKDPANDTLDTKTSSKLIKKSVSKPTDFNNKTTDKSFKILKNKANSRSFTSDATHIKTANNKHHKPTIKTISDSFVKHKEKGKLGAGELADNSVKKTVDKSIDTLITKHVKKDMSIDTKLVNKPSKKIDYIKKHRDKQINKNIDNRTPAATKLIDKVVDKSICVKSKPKNKKLIKKKLLLKKLVAKYKDLKGKLLLKKKEEIFYGKKKLYKYFFFLKKIKINLINQLTVFFNKKGVELKMNNILKSNKISNKFKLIYSKVKKDLLFDRLNKYNRQFNEIYASLALSFFLVKARPIVQIFSLIIGYNRFRNMKKTMSYMLSIISFLSRIFSYNKCIKFSVCGKFKGKAKRTQLKYLKTRGEWNIKTSDANLTDFHVGYVGTGTGIFGIKLWLN